MSDEPGRADESPDANGTGSGGTVEFRIHGIGNHSPWSALGKPRIAHPKGYHVESGDEAGSAASKPLRLQPNKFVESYAPPPAGDDVWLLNWARTSRRTARLAWFLAIPFTMINVAGHMAPPGRGGRARFSRITVTAAVYLASILASISAFTWIIVIVETGLKHMGGWDLYVLLIRALVTLGVLGLASAYRVPGLVGRVLVGALTLAAILYIWFSGTVADLVAALGLHWVVANWEVVYRMTTGMVGLALGILVVMRAVTRRYSAGPPVWTGIHAVIFAAAGILVAVFRPAQWGAPPWMPAWATVPQPTSNACRPPSAERLAVCADRLDVVTLVIVLTTALGVLLSLVTLVSRPPASSVVEKRPNVAAAALLITLALVSIHAMGSVMRVGLDWVLVYVDRMTRYVDPHPGWPNPVPFRALTPYDSQDAFIYHIDLIVLGALLFGLSLGAAFLVAVVSRRRGIQEIQFDAPDDARISPGHRVVQALPLTLPVVVGVGLPLFVVAAGGLAGYFDRSGVLPGSAMFWIALIVQMTALLFLLLTSGRLAKARDILERFADVAGFWRVHYHPLAGASYRPHVLRGLLHEIARSEAKNIVVVGHSQGSVLAACIVGQHFESDSGCRRDKGLEGKAWRLVTCGSPLSSLYGAFFPAHVDESFFRRIRQETLQEVDGELHGHWVNCWRTTDPIASPIPFAEDQWLPDPRLADAKPCGHGDYWTDETQMSVVAEYRVGMSAADPMRPANNRPAGEE